MALTYSQYLKVDELLGLQQPLSSHPVEHDETLFIVIHQVYELWFKQVLHEVDFLKLNLRTNNAAHVLSTFKRILSIFKTLVGQIDILETMTPLNFASFRSRLESSSGFQSSQFRELEFALGAKNEEKLKNYTDPAQLNRLNKRLEQTSVYDDFMYFLFLNRYEIPESLLARDWKKPNEESPEVHQTLVKIYKTNPALAQICERFVDLDEGIQEWRYRHVKMVERTIGFKQGTGGSPGAPYLRATLFKPLFPDLWTIRMHF
jgi:tryptophan 2,3-dioxygenase